MIRWMTPVAFCLLLLLPAVSCDSDDNGDGSPADTSQQDTMTGETVEQDPTSDPTTDPAQEPQTPDSTSEDIIVSLCIDPPIFEVVADSTDKVCQITGETDHETGLPGQNLTVTQANVFGTDLGNVFEHDGLLWVFFGDTVWPFGETRDSPNPENANDSIAFSNDTDPSDCLDLQFVTFPDDGTDPPWWRAPVVPGVDLGDLEVPQDGFSSGDAMFVWFSTDSMTRSVLAMSEDNADTFEFVRDFGNQHFVNVSVQPAQDVIVPGLSETEGDWLFVFGGGEYRAGHMYVAAVPLDSLVEENSTQFLTGLDENCVPQWSNRESDAQPVIETEKPIEGGGCVGELSVHYDPHTESWIALYNCDFFWIALHTAATPWGPWTQQPVIVLDPCDDEAYCHYIHWPTDGPAEICEQCTSGPNPTFVPEFYDMGSPYAPYVIERFSTFEGETLDLYFVMSTWNPYNVLLMTTSLQLQ